MGQKTPVQEEKWKSALAVALEAHMKGNLHETPVDSPFRHCSDIRDFNTLAEPEQGSHLGIARFGNRDDTWINSEPLRLTELRGKVVLVEFWTFGCYNCQNVEPYVKNWHEKFQDRGLVVIGVHSLEFGYERVVKNVRSYVLKRNIRYAVAVDNDYKTWNSYRNRYWPAMYLIDKQGVIRHIRFGEGGYDQTEQKIRDLLAEP